MMEIFVSPTIKQITGMPSLMLTAPDGVTYCAVSGAGLYLAHNGDHFVAEWPVDQEGEWQLEWQGFESDGPLRETLEVVLTAA